MVIISHQLLNVVSLVLVSLSVVCRALPNGILSLYGKEESV